MANLTDRKLQSLKPAKAGKHYDVWERDGFGVRISDKGTKSFVLAARYAAGANPTRRTIGHYPTVSLAQARKTASQWRQWIAEGKDPAVEIERQRIAEAQRRAATFGAVAEDFIAQKLPGERKGSEVARDIRRVFIPLWGKRPITDIMALEIRNLVVSHKATPYQAHNLLGYVRRIFNWAIAQHCYGIESSPCDRIVPKDIIGEKKARKRVLNDVELRAVWRVSDTMGYPFGPLFQLLLLTGARRSEVEEAVWSEFDLAQRIWTIPPERTKTDTARIIPLSDDAITILNSLPRFKSGDYLFSAKYGKTPATSLHKAKDKLDAAIRKEIGEFPPFVVHDLRRTARTRFSAIPNTSDLVRELVIGHKKPGLHDVYDQYAYLDEKRFCLDSWAGKLRSIVNPAPAKVVQIGGKQRA